MTIFKVPRKLNTNIMQVSSDFLSWIGREESHTNPSVSGQDTYQVMFLVNLANALQENALSINVKAYYETPRVNLESLRGSDSNTDKVLALKQSTSRVQQAYTQKNHAIVGTTRIDLSKYLNTTTASKLSQYSKTSTGFLALLPSKDVIYLAPDSNRNITQPPNMEQTARSLSLPVRDTSEKIETGIAPMCLEIIEKGYDPASVFKYPFPVQTAQSRMAKISSTNGSTERRNNPFLGLVNRHYGRKSNTDLSWHRRPANWKGNDSEKQAMRLTSISSVGVTTSNITLKKRIPLNWHLIQVPFTFDKNVHEAISASVFFDFTVIDKFGRVKSHIIKETRLSSTLRLGIHPLDPPTMHVCFQKQGTNRIDVVQTDCRATSVMVFAKIIDWRELTEGGLNGFAKIVELPTTKERNAIYFHHVTNDNPIIYRVIAIANNGNASPEFDSSVVIPGTGKVGESRAPLRKRLSDINEAVLIAKKIGTDIHVEMTSMRGIYIQEVAVDVFVRPSCTRPEARITNANRIARLKPAGGSSQRQTQGTSKNNSRTFIHNGPQNGIIYEYRAVFKTKHGVDRQSHYKTQFEYWDDDSDLDKTSLDAARVIESRGTKSPLNVKLVINSRVTEAGLENTIKDIKGRGVFSSFVNDIDSNKGRIQDLVKSQVRRFDKITGEWVDFGVINGGTFQDSNTRNQGVVPRAPLKAGGRYTYEVKLLKASVFELLRGIELPEKDEMTLTNYSQKRGRFENSQTRRTNTLPPNNERSTANNSRGPSRDTVYRQGATNHVRYIDIDVPSNKPTLRKITVTTSGNEKLILISGRVIGTPSMIDSIHIFATLNGIKAIVGVTHLLGGKNAFAFVDRTLSGVVGIRDYSARIMYSDYSVSDETPVVSFIQRNNLTRLEELANGF